MPWEKTEWTECCASGVTTGPVEGGLPDDVEDTRLPIGWAQITVRVKVPNPGYALEQQEREGLIAGKIDEIRMMAAVQAGIEPTQIPAPTPEESAALRETAAAVVDRTYGPFDEAPFDVVDEEYALHFDHLGVLKQLGIEDFTPEALGFAPVAPVAPVAVPS